MQGQFGAGPGNVIIAAGGGVMGGHFLQDAVGGAVEQFLDMGVEQAAEAAGGAGAQEAGVNMAMFAEYLLHNAGVSAVTNALAGIYTAVQDGTGRLFSQAAVVAPDVVTNSIGGLYEIWQESGSRGVDAALHDMEQGHVNPNILPPEQRASIHTYQGFSEAELSHVHNNRQKLAHKVFGRFNHPRRRRRKTIRHNLKQSIMLRVNKDLAGDSRHSRRQLERMHGIPPLRTAIHNHLHDILSPHENPFR